MQSKLWILWGDKFLTYRSVNGLLTWYFTLALSSNTECVLWGRISLLDESLTIEYLKEFLFSLPYYLMLTPAQILLILDYPVMPDFTKEGDGTLHIEYCERLLFNLGRESG